MDGSNLSVLPIDAPVLYQKMEPFDFDNPANDPKKLAKILTDKMTEIGAVGLSANQLGLATRLFVFGVKSVVVCFNAQILALSKETVVMREGCVSIPGLWLNLKRPAIVRAEYYTEERERKEVELRDMAARVFLHEYDHMEGITMIQRASPLKLKRALSSLRKNKR